MIEKRGLSPVIVYFLVQHFRFIFNRNECYLVFNENLRTEFNSCTDLAANCTGSGASVLRSVVVKQGWLGISCSLFRTSHDPTTISLLCCKALPRYRADCQIPRHSCSGKTEFHWSLLLTMSCESELSASWFYSPTYLQHDPQCLNNSSKTICCPVSLTTPPQQTLVKFGSPVPLRSPMQLQSHHEAPFILFHFTRPGTSSPCSILEIAYSDSLWQL